MEKKPSGPRPISQEDIDRVLEYKIPGITEELIKKLKNNGTIVITGKDDNGSHKTSAATVCGSFNSAEPKRSPSGTR